MRNGDFIFLLASCADAEICASLSSVYRREKFLRPKITVSHSFGTNMTSSLVVPGEMLYKHALSRAKSGSDRYESNAGIIFWPARYSARNKPIHCRYFMNLCPLLVVTKRRFLNDLRYLSAGKALRTGRVVGAFPRAASV